MWPTLSSPDWLKHQTNKLAAQLGGDHSDVVFLSKIVDTGRIDDACLRRVTDFVSLATTSHAADIALRLSTDCIQTATAMAAAEDINSGPHTLYCGRMGGRESRPQPYRDRKEALGVADAILRSPRCPSDIWLRMEGPGAVVWDAVGIREALAMRAPIQEVETCV